MAKAEKGDLIRVIHAADYYYNVGGIYEVKRRGTKDTGVFIETNHYEAFVADSEYEIHRKAGEEGSEPTQDAVEHPNHYTQGRFETIEVIEEITQGYSDGYVAYCVGNALKYLARAPYKHAEPTEDLAKAERYIRYAIERLTQK